MKTTRTPDMTKNYGSARVKLDSNFRYKGLTLTIVGIYMVHNNGLGVYPDGTREFQLSLKGTQWENEQRYTVIAETELDQLDFKDPLPVTPISDHVCINRFSFQQALAFMESDLRQWEGHDSDTARARVQVLRPHYRAMLELYSGVKNGTDSVTQAKIDRG